MSCLALMHGGEVFVPRIPSMKVLEIAEAHRTATPCGGSSASAPGEKVHEVLLTEDESRRARALADRYVIYPQLPSWAIAAEELGEELPPGFRYSSDSNDTWLEAQDIREMAELIPALA